MSDVNRTFVEPPVSKLGEMRRGWPVLLACLLGHATGVHGLPPYTIGLFMQPLQAEFGWSRTAISLGITVSTIAIALSAPVIGALVGRYGERRLIASSYLVLLLSYAALSGMGPSVVVYWTIMGVMALLGSGCSPVTLSRLVVRQFDRARGLALGLTLVGAALPAVLAPVLLVPILAGAGWRAAYAALAALMVAAAAVVLGLLVLASAGGPPGPALASRGKVGATMAEAVAQPLFGRLALAFLCIALGTGGAVVHFVPMLTDAGHTPAEAGRIAILLGLSIIVGRLAAGTAVDHVFAPRVGIILMGLSALGFLALSVLGAGYWAWAAVFVGMSLGAEHDLIAYLTSRYYRGRLYGRSFGLFYSAFLVGVSLSPVIYAELHRMTGTYGPAFAWAAACLAVAALVFATLPSFPSGASPRDTAS